MEAPEATSDATRPFGKPGYTPTWSPASKHGIGTARNDSSKVWFTLGNGIVNEVYYPTVNTPNTRDLRLLVTDGRSFFDEEGTDTLTEISYINEKALAYKITNTAKSGRYRITKRIVTDPAGQSLVIKTRFEVLEGDGDLSVYLLFAPHLNNRGYGNSGRCAQHDGRDFLFAVRGEIAAAVTASVPFLRMSAGYVGESDGWQDLHEDFRMDWTFERVEDGNIALIAEIDVKRDFTVALGFGVDEVAAAAEANKALSRPFGEIEKEYINGWQQYLNSLTNLSRRSFDRGRLFWKSAMVLKAHEDKTHSGGVIASLSIPWGEIKNADADGGGSGGYHLVWPRDLVKAALAFLAMGDEQSAVRIAGYLRSTQLPDGSWPQNMWLDGTPYWGGLQLDEVAVPIILAWRLKKMGLAGDEFYPMVKAAASCIVRSGPITEQERWEEMRGFSPSTLASEIAALVCAGAWAREKGDEKEAAYMLSIADYWATNIETWTFAKCDCLGRGLPGHYLRIVESAPEYLPPGMELCHCEVFMPNIPGDTPHHQGQIVDAGFLDLVRYGIRAADDEHIKSSIEVVDAMLKVDLPQGPAFYRYNGDGYGEKHDGSPYDGSGVGRPWPLLTGERAMFELTSNGNAETYIKAMEGFANEGRLLPEQIWDREEIAAKNLYTGKGTGAATPLMWAHAEYIKVLRSKNDGHGCDLIPEVYKRYVEDNVKLDMAAWKINKPIKRVSSPEILRIISMAPATLVWTNDDWHSKKEHPLKDSGLGLFYRDFKGPNRLKKGSRLIFTFHYKKEKRWEGRDYTISID